ncbi:MAG: VOC family protein [Acidimicrobiales bacterium]
MFQLLEVIIAADAEPWRAAGFAVETIDGGGVCRVGSTTLALSGASAGGGEAIGGLAIEGLGPGDLDGITLVAAGAALSTSAPVEHPNGVTGIDHLVVRSPDVDRTTAVLVDAGLELRRERRFPAGEATVRQSFFWMGDVICELVGDDTAHDPGPAIAWGLALTATDLDRVAAVAGDAATAPKPAVQPGRHIMAIHGLGLPVAVMTPHRKR